MVRNRIAESLKAAFRNIDTLRIEYEAKQPAIEARLEEFRRIGREGDERLFEELCFCLIAIQSRARTSDAAVAALRKAELLWSGGPKEIAAFLQHRTRFHNHKATFIVRAREQFFPRGRVRGLGLKEASHFLRNTGRGEDLAILDRHILRNLIRHGVLRRLPRTLTPRRYLDIERRIERFSKEIGIPMAALDLIFWSRETGEIFK